MNNFLNTTLRNIAWFKQAAENNQLEMRPAFQRNTVWLTKEKSYLIDTILNGYPIPEIYMQENIDDEGVTHYIVVDGQQRLTAVLDYMSNSFPIDEKQSPAFLGARFLELTPEQRRLFFQYNFVVRILPQVGDGLLREIFQRLNKNVAALNQQELRQATYSGEFITIINDISDLAEFETIGIFTANDRRRMLDAEYVSELAIALLNGLQNKKTSLESYYQYYSEHEEDIVGLKDKFSKILGEIVQAFPEIRSSRWSKKTDFYTLFLVLGENIDKLPLSSDRRDMLRNKLISFGDDVSRYQQVDSNKEGVRQAVSEYAAAVRASSDLSCRRTRREVLISELSEVLS